MVDTNRSGTVDFNECTQCLHQIGYRLSPQTIVALMRAHDVDGNGYLQYDEFIALNAELSILTAQFQRYDVRVREIAHAAHAHARTLPRPHALAHSPRGCCASYRPAGQVWLPCHMKHSWQRANPFACNPVDASLLPPSLTHCAPKLMYACFHQTASVDARYTPGVAAAAAAPPLGELAHASSSFLAAQSK